MLKKQNKKVKRRNTDAAAQGPSISIAPPDNDEPNNNTDF